MKKLLVGLAVSLSTIGLAGAQTVGAPPPLIPFSGTMTAASGAPFVGLVSAMFSLYEEPEGGVPLWVDIQMVQTDAAGGYLALLGAATELPVDLFATSRALWLGVQPEGQAEQPRVQFISVPYALKASDADTLGGRPLADFVLLSGGYGESGGGYGESDGSAPSALADSTTASVGTASDAATGWGRAGTAVTLFAATDNVGIGTASPGHPLDVRRAGNDRFISAEASSTGTGYVYGAYVNDSGQAYFGVESSAGGGVLAGSLAYSSFFGANSNTALHLGTNGSVKMTLDSAGKVGVGTLPNLHLFDVRGPGGTRYFNAEASSGGTGYVYGAYVNDSGQAYFGVESSAGGAVLGGSLANSAFFAANTNTALHIGSNGSVRMTVAANGDVGIGTTAPTAKLHVAGTLKVDAGVEAVYQDVAEWVEAVGAPTPGTVVVADPLGRDRVKVAETPYDTKVLGAVSRQPGLALGIPGPTKVLVAQSGRVKVKVDANYGSIAVGDILTTSATPGHARRSDPLRLGEVSLHRPGTVLGKALEPLSVGRGEILVLITLQ